MFPIFKLFLPIKAILRAIILPLCLGAVLIGCGNVTVSDLNPSQYGGTENGEGGTFETSILPLFSNNTLTPACTSCHVQGGVSEPILAAPQDNSLSAQDIYNTLISENRINTASPEESLILSNPLGNNGHVQAYPSENHFVYIALRNWISSGADF